MYSAKFLIVGAAVLSCGVAGCSHDPSTRRADALEAQQRARAEEREARRERAEKIAKADEELKKDTADARQERHDAVVEHDQRVEEASKEAREKIESARAEAAAKGVDANAKAGDGREFHDWGAKKLEALDAKIDDVRKKASDAKPDVRARVTTSLRDVSAERDRIAHELDAAHPQSAAKADEVKQNIDSRIGRLERRVDALREHL